MKTQAIIDLLPYQAPFLFVEELTLVSDNGTEGYYTFKEDEYFYKGHFKDSPITPGVILTEVMAQIGVVCLGVFLLKEQVSETEKPQIVRARRDLACARHLLQYPPPLHPHHHNHRQSDDRQRRGREQEAPQNLLR